MEESCKTRKFHFPGYDGALPKATRTSRGRNAYQRKLNRITTDLNCIELLATVAGQVLQAKGLHEEDVVTQISSASETRDLSGRGSSHQVNLPSFRFQQSDDPRQSLIEDLDKPENCQGLSIMKETHEKDTEKLVVSNFSKGAELPSNNLCLENARNNLFAVPNEGKAGSCNREEGSTSEVNLVSMKGGSGHAIIPALPDVGHFDSLMQSEDLDESNVDRGSIRGTNVNERGSCMTLLPDNIPHPLRFNSSKEASTHVHKPSHSLCSEPPLRTHLDLKQDLIRSKEAKDDDDNFSDLVVPVTTSPVRLLMPLIEKTHQLMQGQHENKLHQVEASVIESETQGILTNGAIDGNKFLHRLRPFSSQQPQGRKRRRTSKPSKISIDRYESNSLNPPDLYKSSSLNPLDLDAKDTSVGSSPTATEGLRRSVKKKSNETHDCSPVKVNITSFRVPELSINLPETATVASLKRAVMEAAVNLLGGGLHVRVLHHGKKVHDENSTLIQMGIACKDRLDSLAFMLEPSGVSNTSMNMGESIFALPKGKNQHAACYPVFDDIEGNGRKAMNGFLSIDAETDVSNSTEVEEKKDLGSSANEYAKLQECFPSEPPTLATAALILHPLAEGAELVMSQQNYGSFSGKRRTRRPFSVLEVEALVQAVELLGTGRWREVKQQVFSHARHRTYVDLKDKWKTLVHTARIAPHQRRGEPVPQELLDRVLQAHTFWAVQLAKQHEDMGIQDLLIP